MFVARIRYSIQLSLSPPPWPAASVALRSAISRPGRPLGVVVVLLFHCLVVGGVVGVAANVGEEERWAG